LGGVSERKEADLKEAQMTQTTEQDNAVTVFKECLAAWSTRQADPILAFFTDDCIYENFARQTAYRGKEALRDWLVGTFAAIPDFSLEVLSLFGSGSSVACEWVMSGTHSGDALGFPATGRRFSVRGSTVAELSDGKIRRNADYWDLASFLQQLGILAR
jgi:steroid delta-isomerase-like uncharacterized protein